MSEISEIRKELKDIKELLLSLNEKVDKLDKSSKKMDSHINFIEDTYDNLKSPINFMKNKINTLITYDIQEH